MINQQKEPLFNAHLTCPRTRIPIPFSTHGSWPRALSLVLVDAQGDPGADHRLAHFEFAAGHRDAVRSAHRAVALLHLHGLGEAALGRCVGGAVAGDPQPAGRRATAAGARRFDQPEDGQEDLRLSENVRSCRQEQPDALAVGADHRHGGAAQTDPRALELYPVGLRLLPAPPDAERRLHPPAPQIQVSISQPRLLPNLPPISLH